MPESIYDRDSDDENDYPIQEDIEYHRYIETGEVATIADYSLEDWPNEDSGYDLDDPKHPTFHDRYSDLADMEDF